jgi:hypothetical protein
MAIVSREETMMMCGGKKEKCVVKRWWGKERILRPAAEIMWEVAKAVSIEESEL